MFRKFLTQQNMIMAFGIPYGILLNYLFFSNVVKDHKNQNLKLKITDKMS
jgi:hypothetical protein